MFVNRPRLRSLLSCSVNTVTREQFPKYICCYLPVSHLHILSVWCFCSNNILSSAESVDWTFVEVISLRLPQYCFFVREAHMTLS